MKKKQEKVLNQHSYLFANSMEITEAKAQFEEFRIMKRKQKEKDDGWSFLLGLEDDEECDNYYNDDDDLDNKKYGGADGEYDTDDEFYFYDENVISDDDETDESDESNEGNKKNGKKQQVGADNNKKKDDGSSNGNGNNDKSSDRQQIRQQLEAEQELKEQQDKVRKRQEEVKDKKDKLSQQMDVVSQQRTELIKLESKIMDQLEKIKQQQKRIREQQQEFNQLLEELRSHQQILQLRERQQKEVHNQGLDVYRSVFSDSFFDIIQQKIAAKKLQQQQQRKHNDQVDTNSAANAKPNEGKGKGTNTKQDNKKRTYEYRKSIRKRQRQEEEESEGVNSNNSPSPKKATMKKRKLDDANNDGHNQQSPSTAQQRRGSSSTTKTPPVVRVNAKEKEEEDNCCSSSSSSEEEETDDETIAGQKSRCLMERLIACRQWRPNKKFKPDRHPLARWLRRERVIRKREYGWLRKQEAELAGREIPKSSKRLSTEERKLSLECYAIIRSLPRIKRTRGFQPMVDLGHAFGLSSNGFARMDRQYVLNGLDASRRSRSDAGENVFNSEAKRKMCISPVICYVKSRQQPYRLRGDYIPSPGEFRKEFYALSDEAKLPYIRTAEQLQEKARNLDQKLEEALRETKGGISYAMLQERLNSEFPFPVVSKNTINHHVKTKKLMKKDYSTGGINPHLINPQQFHRPSHKRIKNRNNNNNSNKEPEQSLQPSQQEPTQEPQQEQQVEQQQEVQQQHYHQQRQEQQQRQDKQCDDWFSGFESE